MYPRLHAWKLAGDPCYVIRIVSSSHSSQRSLELPSAHVDEAFEPTQHLEDPDLADAEEEGSKGRGQRLHRREKAGVGAEARGSSRSGQDKMRPLASGIKSPASLAAAAGRAAAAATASTGVPGGTIKAQAAGFGPVSIKVEPSAQDTPGLPQASAGLGQEPLDPDRNMLKLLKELGENVVARRRAARKRYLDANPSVGRQVSAKTGTGLVGEASGDLKPIQPESSGLAPAEAPTPPTAMASPSRNKGVLAGLVASPSKAQQQRPGAHHSPSSKSAVATAKASLQDPIGVPSTIGAPSLFVIANKKAKRATSLSGAEPSLPPHVSQPAPSYPASGEVFFTAEALGSQAPLPSLPLPEPPTSSKDTSGRKKAKQAPPVVSPSAAAPTSQPDGGVQGSSQVPLSIAPRVTRSSAKAGRSASQEDSQGQRQGRDQGFSSQSDGSGVAAQKKKRQLEGLTPAPRASPVLHKATKLSQSVLSLGLEHSRGVTCVADILSTMLPLFPALEVHSYMQKRPTREVFKAGQVPTGNEVKSAIAQARAAECRGWEGGILGGGHSGAAGTSLDIDFSSQFLQTQAP